MPRRIKITPEQEQWLRDAHAARKTPAEMAAYLNCCEDTIKRHLTRLRLAVYNGAKYQYAEETAVQMWTRPCSRCRKPVRRPKWQYYCYPCGEVLGHH